MKHIFLHKQIISWMPKICMIKYCIVGHEAGHFRSCWPSLLVRKYAPVVMEYSKLQHVASTFRAHLIFVLRINPRQINFCWMIGPFSAVKILGGKSTITTKILHPKIRWKSEWFPRKLGEFYVISMNDIQFEIVGIYLCIHFKHSIFCISYQQHVCNFWTSLRHFPRNIVSGTTEKDARAESLHVGVGDRWLPAH